MAKRKRKAVRTDRTEEPPWHLVEHMRSLGLESVEGYLAWCKEHGFRAHTGKSHPALQREREEVHLRAARVAAGNRRKLGDPLAALEEALHGTLDVDQVGQPEVREAVRILASLPRDRPHRNQLVAFMRQVAERGKFLLDTELVGDRRVPYVAALIPLNERRGEWLRPLEDWRPRSHNRRKQFSSLARHLLARYPVPAFMDTAWLRSDEASDALRDLFVHIGAGKNPRTAKTPVPMTKRVAHHFLEAPDRYSIEGAVRWGQVHALGGGPRLSDAIVGTSLANDFVNDEFWQSVLRVFVAHPMLDHAQLAPLIDFIEHMKFSPTEVVRPDGHIEERPPLQPGFSMSGRTPESLLRQMERWHAQLGRGSARLETWPSSGIGDFTWETGVKTKRLWTIRELRSTRSLQIEGRSMGHCVASYARSCAAARCSIWTMELTTDKGSQKRQTVELSRQRVITQSRGKLNALPTQQERDVLRRWANDQELALGTHL